MEVALKLISAVARDVTSEGAEHLRSGESSEQALRKVEVRRTYVQALLKTADGHRSVDGLVDLPVDAGEGALLMALWDLVKSRY
jgi:hypothetical protein